MKRDLTRIISIMAVSFVMFFALGYFAPLWFDNGSAPSAGHSSPFILVLVMLFVVLLAAMIGRGLAQRLGQPGVLGEIIIGIVCGNIGYYLGTPIFVVFMHGNEAGMILAKMFHDDVGLSMATETLSKGASDEVQYAIARVHQVIERRGDALIYLAVSVWVFSNLGLLLLLFSVGLNTSLADMKKVGGRAALLAMLGAAATFAASYVVALVLLPSAGHIVHIFLAASVTPTSVGIAARIFSDLKFSDKSEAKLVIGIAVIDDIIGLVVLAAAMGIAVTGHISYAEILMVLGGSLFFILAIAWLGPHMTKREVDIRICEYLDAAEIRLLYPLFLCFTFSLIANMIGLAFIIGAFAAGVLVRDDLFGGRKRALSVKQIFLPLEQLFTPIFFVLIGMKVNLAFLFDVNVLLLSFALLLAVIFTKIAIGFFAGKSYKASIVGAALIPRGEVVLVFASIGRAIGALDDGLYASLVLLVVFSLLVSPPMLKALIPN